MNKFIIRSHGANRSVRKIVSVPKTRRALIVFNRTPQKKKKLNATNLIDDRKYRAETFPFYMNIMRLWIEILYGLRL